MSQNMILKQLNCRLFLAVIFWMLKKCPAWKFDTSSLFSIMSVTYKTGGNFALLQSLYNNTLGYNKYCTICENDSYLMDISNCLCSPIWYSDANCTKHLPLLWGVLRTIYPELLCLFSPRIHKVIIITILKYLSSNKSYIFFPYVITDNLLFPPPLWDKQFPFVYVTMKLRFGIIRSHILLWGRWWEW